MKILFLIILNILFVGAIWHLDLNHQLDKLNKKKTGGVFKISPEQGFRYSYYALIFILLLIDFLFLTT